MSISTARSVIAFAGIGCVLVAKTAVGQSYPVKPVRIVVPQSASGFTDLLARPLAKVLGENMGQSFIVENRPGAGIIIGCEVVARAPADGYTLLVVAASFTINPAVSRKLPYDTIRDFSPDRKSTRLNSSH